MVTAKVYQSSSDPSQVLPVPLSSFIITEIPTPGVNAHLQVLRSTPASDLQEIETTYALSPMQQGMLFRHLYEPQTAMLQGAAGVDVEQVVCTLREALDVERFVQAWQQVVDRHAVLRTRFVWNPQNEPIQQVLASSGVTLKLLDWQKLSIQQQSERLNAFLKRDRQQSFQVMQSDSLMRFTLFQTAPTEYQFVWTFHHILLDGRSMVRVLQEVFAVYDPQTTGSVAKSRPYQDYIEQLQRQDWSRSESFWRQLLKGFTTPTPLLRVPTIRPLKAESGHSSTQIQLSPELTGAMRSFAERHNMTPNTLVQAAWALLLHRYSGEESVVFGATRACRKSLLSDGDAMVGLMINTLPVRVDVSAETPLLPWLQDLRSQHLAVRPHENTPLSQVQAWSDVPRGTALFESLVVFEHQSLNDRLQQSGTGPNRTFDLIEQPSFPLVLMGNLGTTLTLKLSYDRQHFEADTIERMLGHLQVLLSGMIANPEQRLVDVPLLTAAERNQMLFEWNETTVEYQQQLCLHQLFEAQAQRTPDAIAVVYHHQSLTYAELNQQANQIAHHLRSLGVGAGQFVGVYLDRGLEMIPALLGILKAGGAYIPLEPSFPNARTQWILESLAVRWVITQPCYQSTFETIQPQLPQLEHLLCLDATGASQVSHSESSLRVWHPADLKHYSIENLPLHNTSEDTAYVIFTSGSTGTPKGVVVKHKPVINLIEWVNCTFNINSCDRILFVTSLCFDLSVYDIFGLLAAGGSIHVASGDDVRDPQALMNMIQTEPITFWDSAPPALQQLQSLFSRNPDRSSSLRLVFMSGDWIPVSLPTALKEAFPGVEVISLGGATEATVWSNFYRIDRVEPHWSSIPYGKPIQNAQYYVLDAQLKPCPVGVTGELYIAGDCLASGYTDPIKTEERFLPNPFSSDSSARFYRTGDLARFFADGNIEFLGRMDHQVKIRGYRIELGEIEVVLSQHPAVQDSIVMAREDQPEEKQLVAYVVSQDALDAGALRHFLREKLPEYMIPAAIVFLDTIPLTQNGKVDRRALPAPAATRSEPSNIIILTQDTLERQLILLWEQILGIQPIDVTDNFFDLGGNSLLAVKLINQVEKSFGQRLSIASLFRSPTIKQFAQLLRSEHPVDQWSILEITPLNGIKPPLFWCQNYYGMIPHLDSDQPFYALESGYQQVDRPETHIKDWATGYIDKIRQIQPEGPYFIGGCCFGGYVALEIAQQLQAQGQKVALLALVETYGPELPYYQEKFSLFSGLVHVASIRRRIQALLEQQWHQIQAKLSAQQAGGRVVKDVLPSLEPIRRAVQHYAPQPYFGRVVLFAGHLSSLRSRLSPKAYWGKLFKGDFTIELVRGTHHSVVENPNGRDLVQRIQACVDRSSQAPVEREGN